MPRRILIIGLLFCFGGLHAIWQMVSALMEVRLFLNFSVLMLPVGIGLLRGRASSRRWARVWIILGYAICALGAVVAVASPQAVTLSWPGLDTRGIPALPYAYVCLFLASFSLYIMQRLLDSPKARAWFGTEGRRTTGYHPFT